MEDEEKEGEPQQIQQGKAKKAMGEQKFEEVRDKHIYNIEFILMGIADCQTVCKAVADSLMI